MKKRLLQATLLLCLGASASNSSALTDDFIASGEDIDFLTEMNSDFVLEEIEYKLRRFVFYRKLEELLFDLNDEYPGINSH